MNLGDSPYSIQGYEFPPLGKEAHVRVLPSEFALVNVGDGESAWEVVGESHYNENIALVAGTFTAEGAKANSLLALLVHEPTNEFDSNAVRVDLALVGNNSRALVRTVGYLPSAMAEQYFEMVIALMDKGMMPVMSVSISGGSIERPNFGVWLGRGDFLSTPDAAKLGVDDLW